MSADWKTLCAAVLAAALCCACGSSRAVEGQPDTSPAPPPGHRPPAQAGGACGGIAGFQCAPGLYCAFEPGQCRMPDAMGACKVAPQICTREYNPVCGCDGRTYGNKCEAAAAGTSVATPGQCPG